MYGLIRVLFVDSSPCGRREGSNSMVDTNFPLESGKILHDFDTKYLSGESEC